MQNQETGGTASQEHHMGNKHVASCRVCHAVQCSSVFNRVLFIRDVCKPVYKPTFINLVFSRHREILGLQTPIQFISKQFGTEKMRLSDRFLG
jgi:hypothetical protein